MRQNPQLPQLSLSLSDEFSEPLIPRESHSSIPVGIRRLSEEEKEPQFIPQSLQQQRVALRRDCMRCGRLAEVDWDHLQCAGCNRDDLHEAGLLTICDSLPPDRAQRFLSELREVRAQIARK